jgi:hypothetical protein
MFSEVIQHTPTWVWVVFVMLVAFGARQLQEQRRTLRKAVTLSLVMAGLSLYGLAWMIGVVATLALAQMTNAWSRTRWSNAEQRLVVPGSWVPLALFMSLFVIKFGVGMNVAVHPELVHHAMFSSLIGLCYGAFSGIFLSRGLAMWRVARLAGATQPAY